LYWSLALLAAAIALVAIDKNVSRGFSVAGGLVNLARAYWIAACVVMHASDFAQPKHVSLSGSTECFGIDPRKQIIPNMLKIQSRRAKLGVAYISFGSCAQILEAYID
jgi:hypothetical protein